MINNKYIQRLFLNMAVMILLMFCGMSTDAEEGSGDKVSVAETGKITGRVLSDEGRKPLADAGVEAVSEAGQAGEKGVFGLTNRDGIFVLEVPPGTYSISATYPGSAAKTLRGIKVIAGKAAEVIISITQSVVEIEEMKVVGKPKADTEFAQLMKRKIASGIMDNISAETMKKIPESDVAGILTRMPGVVMDQGKYLQARGMTKRYNNTTLNGSIIPTTRPNEKLTPLDLFQGGIIDSISVAKTFTPDMPGNFSGGLCRITTKAIPDNFIAKLSFTSSFNTETTFDKYLYAHGGKKDWLGYDDGSRELPGIIPGKQVRGRGQFSKNGFEPRELEQYGEAFNNNWNIHDGRAPLNTDYSLYIGNRWNKFGAVFSVYYKSDIKTRGDEVRNIFTTAPGGGVRVDSSYKFKSSTQYIKEGFIFNFGFDIDEDNKLYCKNFYNRNASDEARIYEGFNSDKNENIRVSRLRYIEEEIYAGQIAGEHAVDRLLKSKIKWRYNYSFGNMYDPDMRESMYEFNKVYDKYFLATDTEALLRMFTEQEEDLHDAALDWSLEIPSRWSWLAPKLQVGTEYTHRTRDFWSRRFAFSQRDMSHIDTTKDPETLLQPHNINPYEFEILETTRPTDSYKALENIAAYYGMLDITFWDWLQIIGGARFERDRTNVETFNPFNPDERISTNLYEDKLLPSISLKYSPINDMNFRLAYSETVSRPEFHELAPFEFTDVVGGAAMKGNPDLKMAEIKNYDFRWEWFFNDKDLLSFSAFYKDITDAIEPTLQSTTQLRSSFTNAKDAWLKGVEFELQKNLEFISPVIRNFSVIASYIYTDSETKISPSPGFVPTTLKRPLVGQPENIFNFTLEYEKPEWGFTARFMYRYIDERVQEIGGMGLPDVMLDDEESFDVVLAKKFWKNYELRLVGQNLSNEEKLYTQGGQTYHRYKEGRTFKAGLSYTW